MASTVAFKTPEHVRLSNQKYYARNPEKIKQIARDYYALHKDRIKEQRKARYYKQKELKQNPSISFPESDGSS